MSFDTECFSMNSDISKRTSDFSEPNKNSARRRATSVLPTPVGPRKKKQPTGRAGFLRPARLRGRARAREVVAFFLLVVFFERGNADASPAGDFFFDVFAGDDSGGGVVEFVALA